MNVSVELVFMVALVLMMRMVVGSAKNNCPVSEARKEGFEVVVAALIGWIGQTLIKICPSKAL